MRIGGEAAVEDVVLGDALGGERHFCEQSEVAHQAVAFALREGAVGFGETGEHRLANVRADLEGLGTDARGEPGDETRAFGGAFAHDADRLPDDAGGKALPTRMDGGDDRALTVGEEHGQAVGGHDRADDARLRGDGGIGLGFAFGRVGVDDLGAVHLPEPHGIGRHELRDDGAVHAHTGAEVARIRGDVEAHDAFGVAVGAARDAAVAAREERVDRSRGAVLPGGLQNVESGFRQFHDLPPISCGACFRGVRSQRP